MDLVLYWIFSDGYALHRELSWKHYGLLMRVENVQQID